MSVGILHPGAMGVSIAATMVNSGFEVCWASDGRSADTKQRADEQKLVDVCSLEALCERCEAIVSVCPPHAAEEVADSVLATGFKGLYLDANAIAPQRAVRMAAKMQAAGVDYVDGGIIGGPAWKPGATWLYLSGKKAEDTAKFFAAGPLEIDVISPEAGKASALKMCYAADTKGTTALLCLVMAAAHRLGVQDDLERQWSRQSPTQTSSVHNRVQGVTAKAWRFAGEMDEMVDTFESVGLPGGFHQAAGELYRRIGGFKDADKIPELLDVLMALLGEE